MACGASEVAITSRMIPPMPRWQGNYKEMKLTQIEAPEVKRLVWIDSSWSDGRPRPSKMLT
jgi:hypothetical protein